MGPSPIASAGDGATTVTLVLGNETRTVRLRPDSLRSPGFAVYVQGDDGTIAAAKAPPSTFLRGTVDGDPASEVVGTLSDQGLSLRAILSTGETWIAHPATELGVVAADGDYAVYRDVDVRHDLEGCAADPGPRRGPLRMKPSAFATDSTGFSASIASDTAGSVTLKVAEIAFDVDHEFFVLNNSSVAETVLDIENILARVTQIYEAEAGITYELTAVVIRTAEPDPYSAGDAASLLAQFTAEWNANMRHIPRDTAHLMTGKLLANGVIGTANIDVICDVCGNADGYGLSRSRFSNIMETRVCVTAHEIGHNWGAQHCDADADCGIMCSQVGGCAGDCVHFGSTPVAAIEASREDALCLGSMTGPLDFPFCDDFNGVLDAMKWSYNNVATVSGGGVNVPSAPTALLLNNCCSGCGNTPWPDDIRSNSIRLGGLPVATLAYHTEFRGSASTAGSQLVVQYLGVDGVWKELNRITANGTSQTAFQMWMHSLPVDARHDHFRLRFHLEGSTPHADWYVDDLTITNVEPDSPILYVNGNAAGGGTGESWATAFRDLQDALGVTECSFGTVEEIWVAAGTYQPDRGTGDRDATFQLIDGVGLYGGFRGSEWRLEDREPSANATTLSGEIGDVNSRLDNSLHVVTASGTGPTTILDGFTVTRGQALESLAPNDTGGGLINVSGSPTIVNCVFQENWARRGGAMNHTLGASPIISDTTFVTNFTFSGGGDASLSPGAAILADVGSFLTIDRARFIANVAQGGGGALYLSEGSAEIRNSLFAVNVAQIGGAIQISSAGVSLTDCTLSANLASISGGGIADDGGAVSLNNCILWNNLDASGSGQAAQVSSKSPAVNFCIVQGLTGAWDGEGNLAANPLFRDPDGADNAIGTLDDDFRLTANSPAIDAGDPSFFAALHPRDLDGFPRVLRAGVDIGAYEFGMADFDQDRVVERSDAGMFTACMTGPTHAYAAPCRVFDFDADSDLDLRDLALLTRYLSHAPLRP